ncbi:SNF2 family N-terminal domain-containing protein [Biscogniauxia marginata]|nr:SNF2 family N-terminal domain-containing protein [Biscogniauxia marginata]
MSHQANAILEGTSEWTIDQRSTTHYSSWQNLQLLPETPTMQGHPVQLSNFPYDQQHTLPSVDMVFESSDALPFNHGNQIYTTTPFDQQYEVWDVTKFQQSSSYGVAPVQGNSSSRQKHCGVLDTGNLQVSHNTIATPVPFVQGHTDQYLSIQTAQEHGKCVETDRYNSQPVQETDSVCFGMVINVAGSCGPSLSCSTSRCPIRFESSESFVGTEDFAFKGRVNPEFTYLTEALLGESSLELEASSSVSESPSKSVGRGKSQRSLASSRRFSLNIIIYGPFELFEDIGSFFQDHDIFLQDPVGCERNVRYCNPHRLPFLDTTLTKFTYDLAKQPAHVVEMDDVDSRPELLDILNSQEDLAEASQPQSVRTTLAKHQKQAVTFMLQREHGWAWDGSRPDIWEAGENGQEQYFINRVSDAHQKEEPPQFYGGIVADPMGLGKTLSMIALIASDIYLDYTDLSSLSRADSEESSERTLVIVPPPLLSTWEEQLTEHVFPNSLPWRRHHGNSRLASPSELEDTMIILTTYHTVSKEWRNCSGMDSSILFTTRWKRVVLDEAHFIRNSESQMARAICSIDSVSRWAVTGTPIQNRLGDLATLLKFLKVYPYSEKRIFEADISYVWKSGNVDEAVKRLKRLSGCLLLRRPKGIIQLPPRRDLQYPVNFTPDERNLYEYIRMQAIAHIDETLLRYGDSTKPHSFVNVLQRIEAMRMVCNLGLSYPSRHEISTHNELDTDNWQMSAQRILNLRREMGPIQCHSCRSTPDTVEGLLDDPTQRVESQFFRCLRFICSVCVQKLSSNGGMVACGHVPPCPVGPVSTDTSALDEPSALPGNRLGGILSAGLPSKVAMLLGDLGKLPSNVKCIVFSTWRMTLDVVEAGLKQALIPCLRFDGKVPQKDRNGVIERFRNDPSIKVLLLTLSCGAVGLTLTVASRAYLMEPHWNPTLEDQALARIHRMGQTREVTTVRFFVRDSFEERVIEVQKSKRDLAGIMLNSNGEGDGQSGNTARPLELLRELI